jgi:hypothetical protein
MTNETQKNSNRLISILMEGKLRRKKAPYLIGGAIIIIVSLYFFKSSLDSDRTDNYFISRGETFNISDIRKAKELRVDLTKLGDKDNHIIYHLSQDKFSIEVLKQLEDSGVKLNTPNKFGENPLEQILLYRKYATHSFKSIVSHNFKVLNDLSFITSDEIVRKASEICSKQNPMTCLKMAFYFKVIGKVEHSKSYAKRACYKPINKELCTIAQNNF